MSLARKRRFKDMPRNERLDTLAEGPGVFVYTGGFKVQERKPTVKMQMERMAVLDEDGSPLLDGGGNVIEELRPNGKVQRNSDGTAMLGGKPKISWVELESVPFRGQDFPRDVPVRVTDEESALKLRLRSQFHELAGEDLAAFEASEGEAAPKRKRRGQSASE